MHTSTWLVSIVSDSVVLTKVGHQGRDFWKQQNFKPFFRALLFSTFHGKKAFASPLKEQRFSNLCLYYIIGNVHNIVKKRRKIESLFKPTKVSKQTKWRRADQSCVRNIYMFEFKIHRSSRFSQNENRHFAAVPVQYGRVPLALGHSQSSVICKNHVCVVSP